jgi:hypothetical protein
LVQVDAAECSKSCHVIGGTQDCGRAAPTSGVPNDCFPENANAISINAFLTISSLMSAGACTNQYLSPVTYQSGAN